MDPALIQPYEHLVTMLDAFATSLRASQPPSPQGQRWSPILHHLDQQLDRLRTLATASPAPNAALKQTAIHLTQLARTQDGLHLEHSTATSPAQLAGQRRLVVFAAWQLQQALEHLATLQPQQAPNDPRTNPAPLRWQIPQVPAHWQVIPGWGLRGIAAHALGSNICLTEDTLLAGTQLDPYVRVQQDILRRQFLNPQFAGPAPTELLAACGGEQAALMLIRHGPLNGNEVVQLQVYGLLNKWIGIATLTALKPNITLVRKDFELFLAALRIAPQAT